MKDKDYVKLAKALGKAKEDIQRTERRRMDRSNTRTAFDVVISHLLLEFLADNPGFEADRFLQIIDAAANTADIK